MNWSAVVTALENSALFNAAYSTWETTHTGQSKATFAEALTLPLSNAGKGIAPPFANMSPTETARWVLILLCASSLAVDREI